MITQSYSNGGSTTLNNGGTVTSGATSFTVTDGSVFPAVTTGASAFDLIIETEIMRCTNRSGNVLTVLRGQEGTSAVSHADGLAVNEIITKQGIQNFGSIVHPNGTYANRPTPGSVGRIWIATDGYKLDQEDGSAWTGFGPLYPITEVPTVSNWTWANQGGATATDGFGHIRLNAPAGNGVSQRLLFKTAPSTPYTITSLVVPEVFPAGFQNCGIGWRNSGTGAIHAISYYNNGTALPGPWLFNSIWLTGPTSGTENGYSNVNVQSRDRFWLQLNDDGTNRITRYSFNGLDFLTLSTTPRTQDIGTPDQVYFYANSNNASSLGPCAITLLSWAQS